MPVEDVVRGILGPAKFFCGARRDAWLLLCGLVGRAVFVCLPTQPFGLGYYMPGLWPCGLGGRCGFGFQVGLALCVATPFMRVRMNGVDGLMASSGTLVEEQGGVEGVALHWFEACVADDAA